MDRGTVLRAGACAVAAATFLSSTAYVVAHPKDARAPLQPPVAATPVPRAAASPAATARATPRITLQPGVRATELPRITYTHVS